MIDTANKSGIFPAEIATVLQKFDGKFYRAEEYHQDYLEKNPGGYTCHRIREHWEFWKKKIFFTLFTNNVLVPSSGNLF